VSGCTVSFSNIVLKRLAPCVFLPNKRDLGVSGKLVDFFAKWSTLTASGFDVLQHTDLPYLGILLRLAARGHHK